LGKNVKAGYTLEEFVGLTETSPLSWLEAGVPVDAVIEQLKPLCLEAIF
jgi:6-phosphogluconate dehydrogenase